ncbi:hypothetical protein NEAUS04_1335 [Nematocida ausubeli]|nr:hypothetical protein NEAUS04_1335 [Nematocida ausubeli]
MLNGIFRPGYLLHIQNLLALNIINSKTTRLENNLFDIFYNLILWFIHKNELFFKKTMNTYTTNTKISADLLKSTDGTSEVPDRSNEAADAPERPQAKGKILHDRAYTASLNIIIIVLEIILFCALTSIIFLFRLLINSIEEHTCSVSANFFSAVLILVEVIGTFISSYFIDTYTPGVKNIWIIRNLKLKYLFLFIIPIPAILAISIVPFLELSTVDSILEFYSYFLYPIGLGFLYWEFIRLGIITFSFPFIYKKEIREKEDGLFHFCKTMIVVWIFIILVSFCLLVLWKAYGQYCLNLDLKYFLIPTTYDPSANSTLCNREIYYNTTRSNSGI